MHSSSWVGLSVLVPPPAANRAALRPQYCRQQRAAWCHRPRLLVTPAAQLSAEAAAAATDLAEWQQSRALLEQQLGLSSEEADVVLEKAFGWGKGSQSYWRQLKVEEPPSQEQIQQVFDLLRGVGVGDGDLSKVVKTFPQVLGCEVALLQQNVSTLQTKWFLKGRVLASTIIRKPQVLGSTVDCEGTCVAECNRCWVRF